MPTPPSAGIGVGCQVRSRSNGTVSEQLESLVGGSKSKCLGLIGR